MRFQYIVCIFLVLFGGCKNSAKNAKAPSKPNIIVIFTDDHGYPDIGAFGIHDDLKTPHIDKLAKGGVIMTNGYVTAPTCSASRAGLLSGRYQGQFGINSNKDQLGDTGVKAFADQTTIAESLSAAGYATGMAGKWHLGRNEDIDQHGFDVFLQTKGKNDDVWNMDFEGNRIETQAFSGVYHVEAGAKFATSFIDKNKDQPFFFYWAPRAPHTPLDAPKKYTDRFPGDMPERRRHGLAMLAAIDDGVGQIVNSIESHGLTENTLIFFVGDNGASLIRVPFIMNWKDQIPAGTEYHAPVISLDVAATSRYLAQAPAVENVQGRNLIPFVQSSSKDVPHEALFWRHQYQSAIRKGKWKYIKVEKRPYLFDLESDAGERINLADTNPEIVRELETDLKNWSETLSPPGLNSPLKDPKRRKQTRQAYRFYFDSQHQSMKTSNE